VADHVRKQLRDAVATRLTGLTTTGSRVYESRAVPVGDANMPGLLIYATQEQAQDATLLSDVERRIEIRVEGVAKVSANLDDTLDLIAKEVEIALSTSLTIGSASTKLVYQGTSISMRDGLDQLVGSVSLTYEATIFTVAGSPDVVLGA
jgi:hypothetical protein